ncbi:MAG: hypothetical protein KDH96_11790 [Candidatus Riesia sp.]|nr:hypothetical protein [Candidatus Riesia sp.]
MEAIKDLNSTRIRETNSIYLNNLKTIRDLLEHKYSSKVKFSINEYDYVKQALHSYYVESIK